MSASIQFVGRIGADAETRTAGQGTVTNFSAAVDSGFGDRKVTHWYRVDFWGKRGESVAPYILKGGQIFVSGELTPEEYNGSLQLKVRANDVQLVGGKREQGGRLPQHAPAFDDDEDSVPF